jgi:hypothetical protein
MWGKVTPEEFHERLIEILSPLKGQFSAVTGPGRSGAIASVYASHFLGIPWVPLHKAATTPLRPLLLIDTAIESGATMRKAQRRTGATMAIALYNEPPRVKFWYELIRQ